MEFIKIISKFYCGIDLHSHTMYVTVVDNLGNILYKRNMPNNFKFFTKAMQPFLPDLAVGVESTYNWYWLADGCHKNNIPFYLGHAYYMKAVTSGKTKNDRIDSKTIANLMRCNFFPPAYAYPRQMRSTRDLLRRRAYYVSFRAAAYAHTQTIFAQEAIPDMISSDVKKKQSRRDLIEKVFDPEQQLSIVCDMDLMDSLDPIILQLEKRIREQAHHHD